jgi:hypothetical protein
MMRVQRRGVEKFMATLSFFEDLCGALMALYPRQWWDSRLVETLPTTARRITGRAVAEFMGNAL